MSPAGADSVTAVASSSRRVTVSLLAVVEMETPGGSGLPGFSLTRTVNSESGVSPRSLNVPVVKTADTSFGGILKS